MKQFSIFILTCFLFTACKQGDGKVNAKEPAEYAQLSNSDYELYRPLTEPAAVLILFGGYQESAEDIQREFKVLEPAKAHNFAVVFSNYNQKLWLEDNELKALAEQIKGIFDDHGLPTDKVYLGGYSSGGNVALILGDYLTEMESLELRPKGIFIVDSPVDLAGLYQSSEMNIARSRIEPSIRESEWLISALGQRFGDPRDTLSGYEAHAVFTSGTKSIDNIRNLKHTKIRMYAEPDTLWWKENRMALPEQMNAHYIQQLSEVLSQHGFEKAEYIPTANSGYRASGERHPHSWSIVETNDLIKWMLDNEITYRQAGR